MIKVQKFENLTVISVGLGDFVRGSILSFSPETESSPSLDGLVGCGDYPLVAEGLKLKLVLRTDFKWDGPAG